MDLLTLARLQFASTTIYHFLFVPLSLGLSFLVAWMQLKHYKTKDKDWDTLARYFGTLFLINFALGVVTGIVQEFQFGMNWSNYSRFVGDIFGAPLAVEALAAFFLESTFLGIWIFGRDKLSPKVHLISIWLVACGSTLSAFWIIVANSFMQSPVAFTVKETAFGPRAEMTNFISLITNPHVWLQFPHTVLAGFTTGAVFVLAISAINLIGKNPQPIFKKLIRPVAIFGLITIVLTIGVGDAQGKYIAKHQPMKLAAAEGLWETTKSAPLSLFSIINEEKKENEFEVNVPYALSILAFNDPMASVLGMNEIQAQYEKDYGARDYKPPVTLIFWSFRIMVYTGSLLMLILFVAAVFLKKIEHKAWFYKMLIVALPMPYLCNTFGWIFTEVGRQPWMVQGFFTVNDGLSTAASVTPAAVLFSLIGFVVIYGALAVIDVMLIVRFIKHGKKQGTAALVAEESEVHGAW